MKRTTGNRIKCAVIGVGYLGKFHAQKFKQLDNAELVAVSDVNSIQGKKIADELQVKFVSDYRDLKNQVDAVTVATTTSSHFEIAKFFLEHGIHVHVEKPITTNSKEAKELCHIAESKNLKLQVGHIERFNPALIEARSKLNKPLFIECHRLAPFNVRGSDVSVVLDLMIHDLDVILNLVGSEPVKISASGSPVLTKQTDIANARLEFSSGTVANVTASRVSLKAERKFRVFQPDQYLSIDFGSGEITLITKTGEFIDPENPPIESQSWNLQKGDALLAETKSFVNSIIEDSPCLVSGLDGLRALELAEQIINDIKRRHQN